MKYKTIFEIFPNYSEKEIINVINKLSINSQELLYEAFGPDLKTPSTLTNQNRQKILKAIIYNIQKILNKKQKTKKIREKQIQLTNNIITDTIKRIDYEPLTLIQEKTWLKKLKLAYYYKVDEKTKKKYFDYYCSVNQSFKEKYDNAEEKEKKELLEKAIEDANEERKKFIENNQRLILKMVYKNTSNVPKEELMQEANIGLAKAVEKFDIETGNKFSTYARWWIQQSINRYIENNGKAIRIPSHKILNINKIKNAENSFFEKNHRKPTIEELSIETGINEEKIKNLKSNIFYDMEPISLNMPLNDTNKSETLESLIEDEKAEFEDNVIENMFAQQMKDIIKTLSINEQIILNMRMGLLDGKIYTYNEIVEQIGFDVFKIRKMERKSLKKIKEEYEKIVENPSYKKKIIKIQEAPKPKTDGNIISKKEIQNIIMYEYSALDNLSKNIIFLKYKYSYNNQELCNILNITEKQIILAEKVLLLNIKYQIKEKKNEKNKVKSL